MPPVTNFAAQRTADGTPIISSVDWIRVLRHEPEHYTDWIRYIHTRDLSSIHMPLRAFVQFTDRGQRCPRWPVFANAQLPALLMDVFSSGGKIDNFGVCKSLSPYATETDYVCAGSSSDVRNHRVGRAVGMLRPTSRLLRAKPRLDLVVSSM